MKLLLMFRKASALRWISHLDLIKVFEKALRRAELPIALSQGFNPRPKMSIALPLPVGTTSSGEYMELELEESMDPLLVVKKLNHQLPEGLHMMQVQVLPERGPAIMSVVDSSFYEIKIPLSEEETAKMGSVITILQQKSEITVYYLNKEGRKKSMDIKPGVRSISWQMDTNKIEMHLETSSRLFVRPNYVLQAIAAEMYREEWKIDEMDIHRVRIVLHI